MVSVLYSEFKLMQKTTIIESALSLDTLLANLSRSFKFGPVLVSDPSDHHDQHTVCYLTRDMFMQVYNWPTDPVVFEQSGRNVSKGTSADEPCFHTHASGTSDISEDPSQLRHQSTGRIVPTNRNSERSGREWKCPPLWRAGLGCSVRGRTHGGRFGPTVFR